MDIKTLNKLARACRKLGISHLKTDEVDLTLANDIIAAPKRKARMSVPVNEALFNEQDAYSQQNPKIKEMSETDLLFWSTNEAGTEQ